MYNHRWKLPAIKTKKAETDFFEPKKALNQNIYTIDARTNRSIFIAQYFFLVYEFKSMK